MKSLPQRTVIKLWAPLSWLSVWLFFTLRARGVENDHPVGTNPLWTAPIICKEYFTIMATGPGEDCAAFFNHKRMMVRAMAAQMMMYNTTLTIFTVRDSSNKDCTFNLPNVKLVDFDPKQLLIDYNFTEVIADILSWKDKDLTRTSDIIRLCIAHRYSMSYVDLDIIFLANSSKTFLREYVPACVWADEEASLELTNSAFCLSKPVLEDMMGWQLSRIKQKEKLWFYTELGPSMFAFVILNKWQVPIITQNHPLEADFPSMMKQIKSHGHTQLHITTMIRMKLHHKMKMDYLDIFEAVRNHAGLQKLNIPD